MSQELCLLRHNVSVLCFCLLISASALFRVSHKPHKHFFFANFIANCSVSWGNAPYSASKQEEGNIVNYTLWKSHWRELTFHFAAYFSYFYAKMPDLLQLLLLSLKHRSYTNPHRHLAESCDHPFFPFSFWLKHKTYESNQKAFFHTAPKRAASHYSEVRICEFLRRPKKK